MYNTVVYMLLTHTHTFNGPFSGTTQVSWYQKGKTNTVFLKQETVSGSGISWAICKSAFRSRQITMPVPYHSSLTDRMPFLPPNQQRQSTEGKIHIVHIVVYILMFHHNHKTTSVCSLHVFTSTIWASVTQHSPERQTIPDINEARA